MRTTIICACLMVAGSVASAALINDFNESADLDHFTSSKGAGFTWAGQWLDTTYYNSSAGSARFAAGGGSGSSKSNHVWDLKAEYGSAFDFYQDGSGTASVYARKQAGTGYFFVRLMENGVVKKSSMFQVTTSTFSKFAIAIDQNCTNIDQVTFDLYRTVGTSSQYIQFDDFNASATAVPEPATGLLILGGATLGVLRKKR